MKDCNKILLLFGICFQAIVMMKLYLAKQWMILKMNEIG